LAEERFFMGWSVTFPPYKKHLPWASAAKTLKKSMLAVCPTGGALRSSLRKFLSVKLIEDQKTRLSLNGPTTDRLE
jgi:hypothetical protein